MSCDRYSRTSSRRPSGQTWSHPRDASKREREGRHSRCVKAVVGEIKDKDLRERESAQGTTERKTSPTGALDCLENTVSKRLHMKQSIDHALNSLKGHSHF
jgi:hypothetical protein